MRAAMALFCEHGIYRTRIADITAHADVGKGVFYNYFETKDALVAAIVGEGLELLERDYLMSLDRETVLEQRVAQLARLHEVFFEEHPDYALLIHQGRGLLLLGGQSTQALRDVFRDYLARLSRWLPPPPQRASWEPDDLLDVAATVAGAVAGYRSFRAAAGLPIRASTIGEALSVGVPQMMERRRS